MKIIQMEAAVYLFLLCFSSTISIKTDESIQELKNQIMNTNILVKEMKIMMSHLIEKQSTCTSESEVNSKKENMMGTFKSSPWEDNLEKKLNFLIGE